MIHRSSQEQNRYDAIVVGAGIGGLVCANYLAKGGLKTLLIEQHYRIGGCCSFYNRKGFTFDIGVHYLGSLRPTGFMHRLFNELELWNSLQIKRLELADFLIFPDFEVKWWSDWRRTLAELKNLFPRQAKGLDLLFHELTEENLLKLYAFSRDKTFADILNKFISDKKLYAVFAALLGNMGLPSDRISAIAACILFRDYLLDGGYYPVGGTYQFSRALLKRYRDNGGKVVLKKKVSRILVSDRKVIGVMTDEGECINSDYVISNGGMIQSCTLKDEFKKNDAAISSPRPKLEPSVSAFINYIGFKKGVAPRGNCANVWYCKTYDVDNVYRRNYIKKEVDLNDFLFCSFSSLNDPSHAPVGFDAGHLLVLAPYGDIKYWNKNRERISETMLDRAEEIRPGLKKDLVFCETATPETIYRYTLNQGGAIYGWASTLEQSNGDLVREESSTKGFYMCGHWVTKQTGQGGVTMASHSGRSVANKILTDCRKRHVT